MFRAFSPLKRVPTVHAHFAIALATWRQLAIRRLAPSPSRDGNRDSGGACAICRRAHATASGGGGGLLRLVRPHRQYHRKCQKKCARIERICLRPFQGRALLSVFRGYRGAHLPANVWHPFGMSSPQKRELRPCTQGQHKSTKSSCCQIFLSPSLQVKHVPDCHAIPFLFVLRAHSVCQSFSGGNEAISRTRTRMMRIR